MSDSMLERDTGLAAMVASAQPGDHGVIADWIEEHLHLDDLAAALRAGLDDPRDSESQQRTSCHDFRYRQIDRDVMVCLATYAIHFPYVRGKQRKEPGGHVVCLCTSSVAVGGARRWGRWLPESINEPALLRLWADLGKDVPVLLAEE